MLTIKPNQTSNAIGCNLPIMLSSTRIFCLLKRYWNALTSYIWGKKVIKPVSNSIGKFIFYCPGCQDYHVIITASGTWAPSHTLTGTLKKPTVRASVLSKGDQNDGKPYCHSYITNGRIHFLDDCTHILAGQTVDLPPI